MKPSALLLIQHKSRQLYRLAERQFMAMQMAWSEAFCVLVETNKQKDEQK